jgi:hypothetical protein
VKIDGLGLHEVALYARGSLAAVSAARQLGYDVSKEGPSLSFLRACDAYQAAMPTDILRGLGQMALHAASAKTTRDGVMQAVTYVTGELTHGAPSAPYYDQLVARLKSVKCVSGAELIMALSWHKKTGSVNALASVATSLAFWLRRANRWDLAPTVLALLMGLASLRLEGRNAA